MIKKRSVSLCGHKTSVSIEAIFWDSLKDIAEEKAITLRHLIETIDGNRTNNLSSALRVYVCEYYRRRSLT